jgi:hypothetical protein
MAMLGVCSKKKQSGGRFQHGQLTMIVLAGIGISGMLLAANTIIGQNQILSNLCK